MDGVPVATITPRAGRSTAVSPFSITCLLGVLVMVFGIMVVYAADDSDVTQQQLMQLTEHSDPQDVKNAQIDFEYETAKCAAYYDLESALARQSGYGDTTGGKGMAEAAEAATKLAFAVSQIVGMSEDALKAQLQIDMTDIAKQLGKDSVNAPLVLQDVGLPCKALIEQPTVRLVHWLELERGHHASK